MCSVVKEEKCIFTKKTHYKEENHLPLLECCRLREEAVKLSGPVAIHFKEERRHELSQNGERNDKEDEIQRYTVI